MISKDKPIVLILAGGKGERFWPRSRTHSPKQLKSIYSKKSLLKETIQRALTITNLENIYIGTNAVLKKAILDQEKEFPKENFIIEPEGKNTAPIIALASLYFQRKFHDPIQVVLSSDAYISPIQEFKKNILVGIQEAAKGNLVLLGVPPTRPETGYGYISVHKETNGIYEVKKFVEKPNLKDALKYIKKSNFYWNPGIFIWKTSTILKELERHAPEVYLPLKVRFPFKNLGDLSDAYKILPSLPIDIAVLEKSNSIRMVRASFQWDDVGSWLSLERILPERNNHCYHQGKEVFYFNSKEIISSVSKDLVVFMNVQDLVVVEEEDVLMVASKSNIGDIKNMLAEIRKNPSLQKYLD